MLTIWAVPVGFVDRTTCQRCLTASYCEGDSTIKPCGRCDPPVTGSTCGRSPTEHSFGAAASCTTCPEGWVGISIGMYQRSIKLCDFDFILLEQYISKYLMLRYFSQLFHESTSLEICDSLCLQKRFTSSLKKRL